eukprot:gb/GECG01014070.1/.p1 GENE.gb/GECG01014070.1/~~gb/GECG01014070.1/.p1  ORF type:complete len:631 (+),score=83.33 gb/GECG01014070.1/:1-1893(+)
MLSLFSGIIRQNFPRYTQSTLRILSNSYTNMASELSVVEHATIGLTETEKQVVHTLQSATQYAHTKNPSSSVVVRIAGGWVRDKLLGLPNHDFDIAVDTMTGQEFAQIVAEYLRQRGQEAHSVAVIQANPGQSKHLETATTKIHGIDVDFVNLRSEEYAQESRIPVMKFGSAEEDAERRDFTLNSLFFNLNEECIEDYTGKGYQDLKNDRIRTPLEPHTTLMDDPLRVMRAVRFASKYAFHVDKDLWDTMQRETVRTALQEKVSKERVGTEFSGMMLGPRPVGALRILHETRLLGIVLQPTRILDKDEADHNLLQGSRGKVPNPFTSEYPDMGVFCLRRALDEGMDVVEMLNKQWTGSNSSILPTIHLDGQDSTNGSEADAMKLVHNITVDVRRKSGAGEAGSESMWEKEWTQSHLKDDHSRSMDGDKETVQNLLLAAVTWPCRMLLADDDAKRKHPISFIQSVVKCHLKWNTRIATRVYSIQICTERLLNVFKELEVKGTDVDDDTRLLLGKAVREAGPLWTSALHIAAAVKSVEREASGPLDASEVEAVLNSFKLIPEAAQKWRVSEAWKMQPHLNGKELMKLGAAKGPQLGALIEEQINWILLHPCGTYEECSEYMKELISRKTSAT